MDLSLPRGINDIEPPQYELHSRVRASFEEVCKVYNFQLMEPASLEHLGTLRVKSGPDVDDEIYAFKDKGGRDVGLRFDLTVGIARYVCSRKDLKLPAKVGASGGIWRYDEPQYGRYRWAHQWDLEIFGPPSVDADAEVIDASTAILKGVGLAEVKVKVGDRGVVEEYIRRELKITDQERLVELMRALDKVDKKTGDQLKAEYQAKGFTADQVDGLLEFGNLRGTPARVIARVSELKLDAGEELGQLVDLLGSRGVEAEYNLSVVRGIDYYTGIVFEGFDARNPRLGSLFGGGRYDALPRLFGRPDLSATGAAGGIERTAMSLSGGKAPPKGLVYLAVAGRGVSSYALGAQKAIRDSRVPCEAALSAKPLSKQMEDARLIGATWAVIIGGKEARAKAVTLRNMESGKEEVLPLEDAIRRLKR